MKEKIEKWTITQYNKQIWTKGHTYLNVYTYRKRGVNDT